MTQYDTDRLLVCDIQWQKLHHVEVLDLRAPSAVDLLRRVETHELHQGAIEGMELWIRDLVRRLPQELRIWVQEPVNEGSVPMSLLIKADSPIHVLPSLRPRRPLLYQIHLAHHVDARYLEPNHAAHRAQHSTEVLCRVLHELRFEEVHADE